MTATLTTSSSWTSGIYLLRIVRADNANDNFIILAVRDDGRAARRAVRQRVHDLPGLQQLGRLVAVRLELQRRQHRRSAPRAVKVSFDRPYNQTLTGQRDWYTVDEIATVYWLEQSGYDVSYASDADLESRPSLIRTRARTSRPATTSTGRPACGRRPPRVATPASTSFFAGSNEVYWKIRFESSATGQPGRVQVCYKSTQSGGADPSGIPTGTWRDPAGANDPENALTGVMYVGDNDFGYFPLRVSAAQGADRIWRYTGLDALAPNTSVNIGQTLVGWEWDSRVANGREPAGVKTLAALARHRQPDPGQRRVPDARLGDGDGDQVHGAERRAGPLGRHQPVEPRAGAERAPRGRARQPHPAGDDQHPRRHGRAAGDAGRGHRRRRRLERHPGPDRRQRDDAGQRLAPRRLERRRRRHGLQRLPHRRAARRRAAARRPRQLRRGHRDELHRHRPLQRHDLLLRRHRRRRRRPDGAPRTRSRARPRRPPPTRRGSTRPARPTRRSPARPGAPTRSSPAAARTRSPRRSRGRPIRRCTRTSAGASSATRSRSRAAPTTCASTSPRSTTARPSPAAAWASASSA